jgi:hypothetical protein
MTGSALQRAVLAYVAAWNTADEASRRELLGQSFAVDGTYVDAGAEVLGREALVAHARRFADRWPGSSITRTSGIDEHGVVGCFTWRVVGPDGATLREGIDFVTVDADGRLSEVRGFFGSYRSPLPPD